jgi:hypothetical protein
MKSDLSRSTFATRRPKPRRAGGGPAEFVRPGSPIPMSSGRRSRRRRGVSVDQLRRTPLNSCTASIIETIFCTGVPACTLCMVLKTNPPPREKTSQRRNTCSRTSPGTEGECLLCVHAAAPEHHRAAKLVVQRLGIHSCRRALHGFRMSKPASMNDGRNFETAPQECLNVFHSV